jgi:glycosyltransferase involved in cell wall biosynthesis
VFSCSALIPLKRVELVAQALHFVTSEVRWIHVGDGPMRGAVESACRGLPGRVRVELRGGMPNADVLALYAELRPSVFLNVSRSEGLPVSMMEAMSSGVPVIATDVGGVREIVSHGANGALLAADPTPAELASALDRFAALPEDAHARCAAAAWETWNTRFRADRNYETFVSLLCA